MSQNKTTVIVAGLLASVLCSTSALANDKPKVLSPFAQCVENRMGSLAQMQNRWNSRTFVGGIHIEAIKFCSQLFSSLDATPDKKDLQNKNHILPASHQEEAPESNDHDTDISI